MIAVGRRVEIWEKGVGAFFEVESKRVTVIRPGRFTGVRMTHTL